MSILQKESEFIGKKFSLLTITEDLGQKGKYRLVKALCECGNRKAIRLDMIKSLATKSCGCLMKKRNHGLSQSPLHKVWKGIKGRCYNPNEKCYKDYGGRGITMSDEWKNNFISFYNWANENGYKKGLFIDRKENNEGYSATNCRFVTRVTNARNKRTTIFLDFKGERKTMSEWAEITGISYGKLSQRIALCKWTAEKALTTL